MYSKFYSEVEINGTGFDDKYVLHQMLQLKCFIII